MMLLLLLLPCQIDVTTTTIAEVRTLDVTYAGVLSRTQLDMVDVDVEAHARVDVNAFSTSIGHRNDARLERMQLVVPLLDDVTVALGDSAVSVGRGLVLALRPSQQVGLDSALRGVHVVKHGALRGQAFAGVVNPQNTDPVSEQPLEDPFDVVAGAEVAGAGAADVSFSGVLVLPRERVVDDAQDGAATFGVALRAPVAFLDVGLEVAVQERVLGGRASHGSAIVGDVTTSIGASTLLVEGLMLSSFAQRGSRVGNERVVLSQPPTLERLDLFVADVDDARALRAQWQADVVDGVSVDVVAMARQNSPDTPAQLDVAHAFATTTWALPVTGARVMIGGGLREETQAKQQQTFQRIGHGDVDAEAPLWSGAVVHGAGTLQLVDAPSLHTRFARGDGSVVVDQHVGDVAVGGGLELGLDTQQAQARHVYAAVVGSFAHEDVSVRFVVGDQRGGLRCAGGVCRVVPAFSGARVEVTARF